MTAMMEMELTNVLLKISQPINNTDLDQLALCMTNQKHTKCRIDKILGHDNALIYGILDGREYGKYLVYCDCSKLEEWKQVPSNDILFELFMTDMEKIVLDKKQDIWKMIPEGSIEFEDIAEFYGVNCQ